MKKTLLLLALCAGSLLSANAEDRVSALVKPGDVKQLAIQLKNDVDYTAFQMKIALPEGVTFAGDPVLSDVRKDAHQIHFNKAEDNKSMTVVVFSYDETGEPATGNLAFKNNKGPVVLVDVTVDGAFKTADVSGITVSDLEFVKKDNLEGTTLPTTIGKLGDVDGTGVINTTDASLILMKLAGKPMPTTVSYNDDAEDVDCDGTVKTVDATEVLKETLRN